MNALKPLVTPFAIVAAFAVALADPPPYRDTEQSGPASQPPAKLLSVAGFRGTPVINTRGQPIAKVSEVILDTQWGHAAYVVLATGGLAGLGEHKAAVPFGALAWDPGTKKFTIHTSDDRLKLLPEFDAEHLDDLDSTESRERFQRDFGERMSAHVPFKHDPYARLFTDRTAVTMTGKVLAVDRGPDASIGDACTRIRLELDDNAGPRTIILAPAWYIARQSYVPKDGDSVTISAVPTQRAGWYAASRVTADQSALVLRDDSGIPVWSGAAPLSPDELRTAIPRHMLLKDFTGAAVRSEDDQPFASINDAVIDRAGHIRFVVVSVSNPSTSSTRHVVPWEAIGRVDKNTFMIHKDSAPLKHALAAKTPIDDLASPTFRRSLYSFYAVEPRPLRLTAAQDEFSDEE